MRRLYDRIDTLHTFGEMAIIEDHPTRGMRAKLQDHGRPVMFVGTTHEHTRDTYRFLSVITNRIITSRDIIWTGKSYGEYYNINPPQLPALPTRLLLDKQLMVRSQHRKSMPHPSSQTLLMKKTT
jgi:hypothetical protein